MFNPNFDKSSLNLHFSPILRESWSIFCKFKSFFLFLGFLMVLSIISCFSFNSNIWISIFFNVLSFFFFSGIYNLVIDLIDGFQDGHKPSFKSFEALKTKWLTLLSAGLISGICEFLGIFLVLPGIYLFIAFNLSTPLIFKFELTAIESLRISLQLINRVFIQYFKIYLLSVLIVIAGLLVFGIGIIITLPLFIIIHSLIFRKFTKIALRNN